MIRPIIRLMRIFWRSALGERRVIFSSALDQVMLLWMPALAVGLVWYTFSLAQVRDLPIGVLNQDNTALSRQLERMVEASPNVRIDAHYRDAKEMARALQAVDVYAVLVIPNDFSRHIKHVQSSPVILKVNAQYGTHSGIIQSGVSSAVRTFSAGVELNLRKKVGMSDRQARASLMPIRPQGKMAFNLSLSYQRFLASDIIPGLLHILATVVGVGVIGRELRNHSTDVWFNEVLADDTSTPPFLAMLIALIGKLFWQMLAFSMWSALILILVAEQNHTALPSVYITAFNAWLMTLISLWLGVILTTLSMSKRMGLSLAGIVTAPAFAFSGITYPIVAMPAGAQFVASILPLTYYLKLQVAQMQAHNDWHLALPTTYGFLIATLVMAILSTRLTFRAIRQKHRWGER